MPVALTALLLALAAPAEAGDKASTPDLPACKEDGQTRTFDGEAWTCAVCPLGDAQLSVWARGTHDAAPMQDACATEARQSRHTGPSMVIKVVAPPERKY
jgi:hypothetical protein